MRKMLLHMAKTRNSKITNLKKLSENSCFSTKHRIKTNIKNKEKDSKNKSC